MLPKLDENSTHTIKDDEELHVFILDDQETTIQKCLKIYGSRTRINKEYWLFDTTNVAGQVFSKKMKITPQIHIRKFEEQTA